MSIADSLISLKNTKAAIKAAIIAKGVAVADTDAFSTYPIKIGNITSGGGTGTSYQPTVLQHAISTAADGYPTLASTPTVGNLLVLCFAHWSGYYAIPDGWNFISGQGNASKDNIKICCRLVISGDTTTPFTNNVNGAMTLFEIAGMPKNIISLNGTSLKGITTQAVAGTFDTTLADVPANSSGLIVGMFSFYAGTTKPILSGDNIQELDNAQYTNHSVISFKDIFSEKETVTITATTADSGTEAVFAGVVLPNL